MTDFVHLLRQDAVLTSPPSISKVSNICGNFELLFCRREDLFLWIPCTILLEFLDVMSAGLNRGVTDEGICALAESGCGARLISLHLEGP